MANFNSKWKNPSSYMEGNKRRLYFQFDQWHSMRKRCKVGGSVQKHHSAYIGCTYIPEWEDYDVYTEWAEQQVGFLVKDERGRCYSLDKDILFGRNKIYSPETCVFVPPRVNSFYSRIDGEDNGLPKGVHWQESCKRFIAQGTCWEGTSIYLGCYKTPEAAHAAYVENKEAKAKQLAEFYKDVIDIRVYDKLMSFKA